MIHCLKHLDNIYYIDINGRVALHYACEKGNIEIVKLLLKKGSPINIYDNNFFTPLYLASFNGFYEIAELLLENGASSINIDIKTIKNIERLQEKSREIHHTSMSKFNDLHEYMKYQSSLVSPTTTLAMDKSNEEVKSNKSYLRLSSTPLISAILNGQNDIVEALIENGTNINEKDNQDLNPFFYACSINNEKAIHLLIEKKVEIENYCDPMKTSIMHFACKYGNIELAEIIIDCFSMFKGNISESSIHLPRSTSKDASFERYCGVNEYNKPNIFGVTPFHWACLYGKRDIIKLFRYAGMDIFQEKDINGNTALHHVCRGGNAESTRLILKYINKYNHEGKQGEEGSFIPIDINERNNEGQTALHIAVQNLNEDIITMLIDNGINQNLLDNNNKTALQYAESINKSNKKILQLLKN